MLTAPQLPRYYPDLRDPRLASRLALVHSRFSTNTFPSWELAHPYRMIAHNGEINTLRGNVNWMRARESQLASELFGDDLQKVIPVVRRRRLGLGDLRQRARAAGAQRAAPIPHAVMMMVPEAYRTRTDLRPRRQGLLRLPLVPDGAVGRPGGGGVHRRPPWPARCSTATACARAAGSRTPRLRRAGLRGGRDDRRARARRSARAAWHPGKLFLVDLEEGRIVEDEEVKRRVAAPQALRRVVRALGRPHRRPARARAARAADRAAALQAAGLRLLAGGPADADRADGRQRRGADRDRWATTPRWR